MTRLSRFVRSEVERLLYRIDTLGEAKTLRCLYVLALCPEKALLVRTLWLNYLVEMPGVSVVRALGGAVAGA
jgi:hypothetical protein